MTKETNELSYFFCYNKNVSDFLTNEGIRYITVAKDIKKNKMFSLYLINEEFQKALNKYKKEKKKTFKI